MPEKFHYQQLLTVKQKQDDPQTFADRVRSLPKKTLRVLCIPAVQGAYNIECEKRPLSTFIFGLRSDIAMQAKYRSPKSMTEALYIANTVYVTINAENKSRLP